jgi:hypothetical protein
MLTSLEVKSSSSIGEEGWGFGFGCDFPTGAEEDALDVFDSSCDSLVLHTVP